jgi:dephospho-CoA kinase
MTLHCRPFGTSSPPSNFVAHPMAFVVGLTGGIGSGKSVAASCFLLHGAVVIDADEISRKLTAPGSPVISELSEKFGRGILQSDGSLDRAALASIVFNDKTMLLELNAIMHPRIRTEALTHISGANPDQIVVYDMPLLLETNSVDMCDAVVVIDIDLDRQVERLVANRGMSVEQAQARIRNQSSREARNRAATWVIDNNGTKLELDQACIFVWGEIVKRAHKINS